MNIDQVCFGNEFIVPYLFQESCPRQRLVTPLHHVLEQPKLARSQIDLTVATLRSPIEEVQLQRSDAQHRFVWRGRPPDQWFSARCQFDDRERLFRGGVASLG